MIQQHLTADPPSAAARRRTVTPDLDAVIRKALEKSPADRFATASQFADAIVAATAKAPIIIEQVTRPGRRFRAGLVAGGVIAVAAIAGSAVMLSSPGAVPFEERDWLLITSFENLTGDSVFDRSLDAALASSISQSKRVNVFPQARVAEALVRMQRADAARLDQPTGIEIAVREGLKAVLVPSISQVEDQYAMSARIVDPTNGVDLAAASVTAESKAVILTSVDKLGRTIRRRLGESRLDLIQDGGLLARATTPSLEALKAFTDAGIAWGSGQEEQARALWEEALRHDSTFAWAHASMGLMYYWYNDRPKGEEHFEQALAGLDRLPRREQLWVRSLIEGSRGDREEASNILEVYLRDYPDDRDAWYNFGSGLMRMGRCDEGIPALERALELDSTMVNAYINTATCHSNSQRPTEAISAYRKAFALDSDAVTGGFINHEYGSVLVEVGEFEEAQRTFEMMLDGQPDQQARGLRSIALLRMFQGRYDEAIDQMRQAVRITRTSEFGLSEFRNRLYLAAAYRTKADTAAHRRELDAASVIREGGLYIEPFFLTLQGKMYARMGELDRADEIVQAIADAMGETDGDRAAYDLTRGELALARGNHAEAIELLEDAKLRRDDRYFTESLAHAYAVSGATDDAIREYEEVVDGIGFGSEAQEPWILAHYELGQLYEAKGEYANAIASYQRFVDIWANADPDIAAAVDEVRRRIETLRRTMEIG